MLARSTWLLVAWLALGLPGGAEARARISLGAIQGEKSSAVTRQLAETLCASWECVPRAQVVTRGKVDFGKMTKGDVAGFLFGSVTSKGGSPRLWLALVTRSMSPARTWDLPLTRQGKLKADALRQLAGDLQAELGTAGGTGELRSEAQGLPPSAPPGGAPPPTTTPPTSPAPAAVPAPEAAAPVAAPAAPAAAPPAAQPPLPASPGPGAPTETAEAAATTAGQWLGTAEAGLFITARSLTYSGVPAGASALRGYQADFIAGPWLRLELYPFSLLGEGLAAGIAPFVDYAFSVGLTTSTSGVGGTQDLATHYSRLDAGLLWRIRLDASSGLALVPAVSYALQTFTFDPPFPGLPDSNLSGVRLSLGVDVPLGGMFSLQAAAAYVYWIDAPDLIGGAPALFPGGSAYAIEAEVGLTIAVVRPVWVRVAGAYSGTWYSLEPASGSPYQATGAKDQYIGGRATALVRF